MEENTISYLSANDPVTSTALPGIATQSTIPPDLSLKIASLPYTELRRFINDAVTKYPDLLVFLDNAVARTETNVKAEALKLPPSVNYDSLRRDFHRELHSMDGLKSSYIWEHASRLYTELEEYISTVGNSVNKNSSRETCEEALLCLQKFMGQLQHADPYVKERIMDGGEIIGDVSLHILSVAELLKEKGGCRDERLRKKIRGYARVYTGRELDSDDDYPDSDNGYPDFDNAYKMLWGESALEGESEEESEEEEEKYSKRYNKRSRYS